MVQALALFVMPAREFPHCRDPKDDGVIAAAAADLVAALRDLEVYIVRAGEFLDTL
jgi:predicted nucleic acid-binding protein